MDHTAVANNAAREEANILADKMRVCVHFIRMSDAVPALAIRDAMALVCTGIALCIGCRLALACPASTL